MKLHNKGVDVILEHALGRVSAIQGNRARFRGVEKN